MGEYINGYVTPQIIRTYAGSPATNFIFSDISNSILIDNTIGSPVSSLYFNFDQAATTGSNSGYLNANDFIALDLRCGSISILNNGAGSILVQVMRLT